MLRTPKTGHPTPQKQFLFKDGDIYLPSFSETKWVRRMPWEEPTAVDDSHLLWTILNALAHRNLYGTFNYLHLARYQNLLKCMCEYKNITLGE